jgi:hypothetical protein
MRNYATGARSQSSENVQIVQKKDWGISGGTGAGGPDARYRRMYPAMAEVKRGFWNGRGDGSAID